MSRRAFFDMSASEAEYVWKRLERTETYVSSGPFDADNFAEATTCEILSRLINAP